MSNGHASGRGEALELIGSLKDQQGKLSDEAREMLEEAMAAGGGDGRAVVKRVDLRKLRTVVSVKKERSDRGKLFVFYLLFTTVYVAAAVYQRNPYNSQTIQQGVQDYMTRAQVIDPYSFEQKGFYDVVTVDDLWGWLQGVFVEKVLVDHYANGDVFNATDRGSILQHNRLTAGFRLTQRRVENGTCIERKEFRNFAPNCYGRLYWDGRLGPVDTKPFLSLDRKERYEYQDSAIGSIDIPYVDSGFFQTFQGTKTEAKERLADLRRQMWINEGTAWMRADFVTYNPNVRIFGYFQFIFDMRPSGQIIPGFRGETMSAALYETDVDWVRLFLELLTVLCWAVVMYGVLRGWLLTYREEKRLWAYFAEFDNAVAMLQLLLMFCCFAIWGAIINDPVRDELVVTENSITFKDGSQPNFTTLSWLTHDYFIACGVVLILSIFRILSMMQVNPNISQLSDTFGRCRKNIVQFGLVLVLMIIAFMLMAHLMFGAKLREFSTFDVAFISTVQIMLGAGQYVDLAAVDNIAAPVFYYPFVFIMVFVVFNMTIAIIMDGYALSQEERQAMRSSYLKELNETKFFHQVFWGMIRQMSPIKYIFPGFIRYRSMADGTIVDRFSEPTKNEVVAMLEPVKDHKERMIPVKEFGELLSKNNIDISEEELEHIVERYHCWEDMDEPVYKRERMLARRMEDADNMEKTITILQERIATIVATQQQMGAKVDAILRSFVVQTMQVPLSGREM
mmetsp:Transcript_19243/g.47199  ORF Transcript_19243/g.47199 Transcript_19243/m.47199 type:complete len:735 (+) Transcript_19243:110-2314(+)|eukprot:CAMPEP_0206264484 /NCGR_PEP_ID=MMETSP0047_2-20121206/29429_1 /ASSEMBLY_ACC=CAM_ASM_000192 /TAXON_ID=195065 /ORGANISM="Chroomonas mesostigmatica_cf, Strain CCMP1168" /LENGTH=734 /DNA_ID=CAMNT_0053692201 /DNA_START=11 /DNA_END=2215 /DNA_ORIENTATION=+